jgi:hypothetical protein
MLEKLWNGLNLKQKTSDKKRVKKMVKTSHKLVERAYWIANLGIQRLPKRAFLELMNGASVAEVEGTVRYLSSSSKGLLIENNGDICVVNAMLGCSHCKYAIISNGWKIEQNKCALSNIVLAKDIAKAGKCENFLPIFLEQELKNKGWRES